MVVFMACEMFSWPKKLPRTCNHNNFVNENSHNVPHIVRSNYALFLVTLAWNCCNYTHSPVPKKHLSASSRPLYLKCVAKQATLALNRMMLSMHWENLQLSMYSRFMGLLCQSDKSKDSGREKI